MYFVVVTNVLIIEGLKNILVEEVHHGKTSLKIKPVMCYLACSPIIQKSDNLTVRQSDSQTVWKS